MALNLLFHGHLTKKYILNTLNLMCFVQSCCSDKLWSKLYQHMHYSINEKFLVNIFGLHRKVLLFLG